MKIGTSFVLNFNEKMSIIEFIKKAHEMGLKVVELVAEPPHCHIDSIDEITRVRIKEFAEELWQKIQEDYEDYFEDGKLAE